MSGQHTLATKKGEDQKKFLTDSSTSGVRGYFNHTTTRADFNCF
jgi:hypothetical protein